MATEVPLSQGLVAIVDDEDAERVLAHKWTADRRRSRWYARRRKVIRGRQVMTYLHRFILRAPAGVQVDHVDGDGLNNRRENLRLCTQRQNSANQARFGGSSRFKGVTLHRPGGKWSARITVNYRNLYLGIFSTEEEAARAYDKAARRHFGEFARLNFPEESWPSAK